MIRRLSFIPFWIAFILFVSPSAQARRDNDQVDSYARLSLLQQATGSSSAQNPSSFQSRLSTIMNTTPSAERTTVALDDAKERQQVLAADQALIEPSPEPSEDDGKGPLKTKDQKKVSDTEIENKLDGSEDAFQKTRDDIQSEFDKRIQKAQEEKSQPPASQTQKKEATDLPPSLANNPFYMQQESNEKTEKESYNERKPIMVSRIMSVTGIPRQEAEGLLSECSSADELMLRLIRDYSLTYGEASDITS